MSKHILFCSKCKIYTMKESCPECNSTTIEPKPPKYSPEDKYGEYRRESKNEEYKAKGYL